MYSFNNSVTLIGNLGRDVEIKTLDSGAKVAKTTIATNKYYTDKNGEKVTQTQWHPVVAWNQTAELMEKLLNKGSKVVIQGELNHDSYKTKEGDTRYFTQVRIHNFSTMSAKAEALPF